MIAGWMGDAQLGPLIKTVSFVYLFLPFLSIWRGYFQGNGFMMPSAFSQMTEQLIRVIAILLFSFLLYRVATHYMKSDKGLILVRCLEAESLFSYYSILQ
ncbi:hypothetical protein ACI2OX_00325 [Bacillus sp. N9]